MSSHRIFLKLLGLLLVFSTPLQPRISPEALFLLQGLRVLNALNAVKMESSLQNAQEEHEQGVAEYNEMLRKGHLAPQEYRHLKEEKDAELKSAQSDYVHVQSIDAGFTALEEGLTPHNSMAERVLSVGGALSTVQTASLENVGKWRKTRLALLFVELLLGAVHASAHKGVVSATNRHEWAFRLTAALQRALRLVRTYLVSHGTAATKRLKLSYALQAASILATLVGQNRLALSGVDRQRITDSLPTYTEEECVLCRDYYRELNPIDNFYPQLRFGFMVPGRNRERRFLRGNRPLTALRCGHLFHEHCFARHTNRNHNPNPRCPVCEENIVPAQSMVIPDSTVLPVPREIQERLGAEEEQRVQAEQRQAEREQRRIEELQRKRFAAETEGARRARLARLQGLQGALQKSINRGVLSKREAVTECGICMNEFDFGTGGIVTTTCAHVYHRSCIQRWFTSLTGESRCPTCSTSQISDQLKTYQRLGPVTMDKPGLLEESPRPRSLPLLGPPVVRCQLPLSARTCVISGCSAQSDFVFLKAGNTADLVRCDHGVCETHKQNLTVYNPAAALKYSHKQEYFFMYTGTCPTCSVEYAALQRVTDEAEESTDR